MSFRPHLRHHPVRFGINIHASSAASAKTNHQRTPRDVHAANQQSIVLLSAKESILERESIRRVAMHWQSCGPKRRDLKGVCGMVLSRNHVARVQIRLMMITKTPTSQQKEPTTNMPLLVGSGTMSLKHIAKVYNSILHYPVAVDSIAR
jgi:hypothetical protein